MKAFSTLNMLAKGAYDAQFRMSNPTSPASIFRSHQGHHFAGTGIRNQSALDQAFFTKGKSTVEMGAHEDTFSHGHLRMGSFQRPGTAIGLHKK